MKDFVAIIILFLSHIAYSQIPHEEEEFLGRLKAGGSMPERLLSTRSVVIYPYTLTAKELTDIQESFQRTGIDAVVYFQMDLILAGRDIATATANYFTKRDIANLVLFQKENAQYKTFITKFSTKENLIDSGEVAWTNSDKNLSELLKKIYRAAGSLERQNLLINGVPETKLDINPIKGRRSEFFAIDLKVDQLAVPKFGDEERDKQLEELFKDYPFKYKLTEPGLSDKELRQQGNLYVLSYLHTRGEVARELLGYDMSKPESAFVSVTYENGEAEVKNIPAKTSVYKFYFKHIDSGNVFLGTKWDADTDWFSALKNHIRAFKSELRIN